MAKNTTAKTTTQVVKINGARVKLTTRNGRITSAPALPLESDLQAAQVRALRSMPEYGHGFLFAGDQNAARRGPKAQAMAVATGMQAGEPDLRVYLPGGRIAHIENKVGKACLSQEQVARHAALRALGHTVEIVRAVTVDDAAQQAVALVRGWIAANDSKNNLQKVA